MPEQGDSAAEWGTSLQRLTKHAGKIKRNLFQKPSLLRQCCFKFNGFPPSTWGYII